MALLRSSLGKVRYKLNRLKVRAVSLKGQHYCPVCDHRVQHFEPLSAYFVENARQHGFPYKIGEAETCNAAHYSCPLCGAADRERLYALYLREYFRQMAAGSPLKIIDFAPSAPLSRFINKLAAGAPPTISYRTADLYREDVDDKIDIADMRAYQDNSCDFFICSHVLEHVADDRRALGELYRILKPGGRGILVVPIVLTIDEIDEDPSVTDVAERWRRFGQDDHVRLYSRQGFLTRVQAAGFTVHQLGRSVFGAQAFAKHGITDQSVLYVVEKT